MLTIQVISNMSLFNTPVRDSRMIPILLEHDWMIKQTSYCKLASCSQSTYDKLKRKYLLD